MQYTYRNHQMFMKALSKLDDESVQQAHSDRKAQVFRQDMASEAEVQQLITAHKARTQRKGRA